MRIDLHTHSAISDGTDSPADLVAKAAEAGLSVIGLCDHDTCEGWASAQAAAERHGIQVLPGAEISCDLDGVAVHLLAYGFSRHEPDLVAELARNRFGRSARVPTMLARLAELGMPIPTDVLYRHVGLSPSVGRPHFADAMVELGYVADRNEAFDRWLGEDRPAFLARYSTPLDCGLGLVHRAGGVSVIAHPWGRGSREVLTPEFLSDLVKTGRLDGIEVDHNDHDRADRAELRQLAENAGALITGSSDYHGRGKKGFELGCNTTDPAVLAEIERRIAERTAAIAPR